ncbi:MAG: type VII secretion protein EccE [Micromonosporaceae bacterium]|nr:type VII secretion protein EccE [Micromonosporaceae bacterium]
MTVQMDAPRVAVPDSSLSRGPLSRPGATHIAARIGLWQLAVLAVLAAALTPSPGRLLFAAACVLVAAPTALRLGGRWLDQWVLVWWRYQRRAGRRFAAPLDAALPGLTTQAHTDRSGKQFGLISDGAGWVAVLRLGASPTDRLEYRLPDVLGELSRAVRTADIRPAGVQLLAWAVPTPGKAAGSAWRVFWVAVRFDPQTDPEAADARGGGDAGAQRAAATAAQRLELQLRARGVPARVLAEAELRSELSSSLGVDIVKPGTTGPATASVPSTVERWRYWSIGALHHATYRMRSLSSRPAALAEVLTSVAQPPALTTCVSVLFRPARRGGGVPRPQVTVRFAVPAGKGPFAVRGALRRAGTGLRRQVTPMNGEHFFGVRATLPIADHLRGTR